jgi:hypothetical protein
MIEQRLNRIVYNRWRKYSELYSMLLFFATGTFKCFFSVKEIYLLVCRMLEFRFWT